MTTAPASLFLRRVLIADAVISGATGLMLIAAAGPLEPLLGLSAAFLRLVGASLLPFAAFVGALARQESPSRSGVRTVVALNAAWVVASVILPFSGLVAPTTIGIAFIVAQAFAVAGLAEFQVVGLRR